MLLCESDKTEFMCFNQNGAISLNDKPLQLVDDFTYLRSNITSNESDINILIGEVSINRSLTLISQMK